MASPRDIRRRIKSINSTAQITTAMQMVAASKMRKAQQATLTTRPFAQLLYRIQRQRRDSRPRFHPSAAGGARSPQARRDPRRHGQGLVRRAQHQPVPRGRAVRPGDDRVHHRRASGRRSSSRAPAGSWRRSLPITDSPRFAEARPIASFARDLFLKGEVDQVQVVATRFINTLTQQAGCGRVSADRRDQGTEDSRRGIRSGPGRRHDRSSSSSPARRRCSAYLFGHYLNIFIYQVLLEAKASEQSARMVAMKNATDNADRPDQGSDPRIQQAAPGQYHQGTAGNRRRPTRATINERIQVQR